MTDTIRQHVAAYWHASTGVTFEDSDISEIYALLGEAEQLIAHLVAELAKNTNESNSND